MNTHRKVFIFCALKVCRSELTLVFCFFLLQIRKKDQINIETKNKTVRFIGELAKFKMFSKTDTLHCLKVADLTQQHTHTHTQEL